MKKSKRILSGILSVLTMVTFVTSTTGCNLKEFFTGTSDTSDSVSSSMEDGTITNSEWLAMVNDAFGMRHEENTDQSDEDIAKEWGVIGDNEAIDMDSPINDQFATKTLMRATGYCDLNSTDEEIINSAIDHGVINQNGDLSDPISAVTALDSAVYSWSNQEFETRNNIVYAENLHDFTSSLSHESVTISDDSSQVTIASDNVSGVEPGSVLLVPTDNNGGASALKVVSVSESTVGKATFVTVPATIEEVYSDVEVSGTFEPDYNNIEILDDGVSIGSGEIEGMFGDSDSMVQVQPLGCTGYNEDNIMKTASKPDVRLEKKLGDGSSIIVTIKDLSFNADVDWECSLFEGLDINRVYFSVDSEISAGIKGEKKFVKDAKGDKDKKISLAKIPIKICPGVSIDLELAVVISVKGVVTVEVTVLNSKGIEIKNGSIRKIDEQQLKKLDIKLWAEAGVLFNFNASLNLDYIVGECKLVALDIKIGPKIKGQIRTSIGGEDTGLVCADVSGYLAINLNVELNDIFKALGLKVTIRLINITEKDSPIVFTPLHIEFDSRSGSLEVNIVEKCTAGGKKEEETSESNTEESTTEQAEPIATGEFKLGDMFITISENQKAKITIESMPSDMKASDIKWSSNNTAVATVDGNGNITAKSAGSAVITVFTPDGNKYSCAVTVKASDGQAQMKSMSKYFSNEKSVIVAA